MRVSPFPVLAVTPFERPDVSLARALLRHGAAVAIDLGRDESRHPQTLKTISALRPSGHAGAVGLRIPDHIDISPERVPRNVDFVVLAETNAISRWCQRARVIVQVTSEQEAQLAVAAGAVGLIAKGEESGGRVGEGSAFVLLQRILALPNVHGVNIWVQGCIGLQ